MKVYDDIYIEELINEDIKTINNIGGKATREKALRSYYSNPNYCQYCGKMIVHKVGRSIHDIKKKKFCDASCAAKYNNSIRFNIKTGPISIVNSFSDDDFIKAYNNSDNYNQLGMSIGYAFINTDIKNKLKYRIQELGLEEYDKQNKLVIPTTTKGELINKRSNWQSWRSTIQKHARSVYKKSDRAKCCIVCGYNKTYEVAHIKAVSDFDDDVLISEINNINNLIALCPNHHWEFDHGQLNIDEYII